MADSAGPSPGLDPGTQAKLSQGGGGGDKDGWEGLASAAISLANLLKIIPMKLGSVGETSVTTGVELNKAGIDSSKPIPAAGAGLSMNGGQSFISKMLAAVMKKPEFGGISSMLQSMGVGPVESVAMSDAGTFRPDYTPAVQRDGPSVSSASIG